MYAKGLAVLAVILTSWATSQCYAGDDSSSLTVEDIRAALGISWWVVTMPPSNKPQAVRLLWVSASGTAPVDQTYEFGGLGFEPGSKVKILFMEDPKNGTASVSVGGIGKMDISISLKDYDGRMPISNGSPVDAGDILIKMHKKSSAMVNMADDRRLHKDEVGLRLDIVNAPSIPR